MSWLHNTIHFCRDFEKNLETQNEDFCDLAYECLSQKDFVKNFNEEEFVRDFINLEETPTQFNPYSNFGSPPYTIYFSDKNRFALELYFWNGQSHTSIHDHSFEGAFTVLSGSSVETVYTFNCNDIEKPLSQGNLQAREVNYIQKGDIRKISYKHNLIHRVIHLENPTVSLALRTIRYEEDQNDYTQKVYNFGVLASPAFADKDYQTDMNSLKWFIERGKAPPINLFNRLKFHNKTWEYLIESKVSNILLQKLCLSVSTSFYQIIIDTITINNLINSTTDPYFKKLYCLIDYYYKDDEFRFENISLLTNESAVAITQKLKKAFESNPLEEHLRVLVQKSKYRNLLKL